MVGIISNVHTPSEKFFFFKQKTAYEIMPSLVGSEMCIRDRAQNINIKKLEIRITPDFVLANKNGIQEYELAERSLKKSILSNVRNVIVEYIEYCKMIVNHDGDAENWYTQLDRCCLLYTSPSPRD